MIRISHLTRRFSGRTAVDDLSLTIAPGERVCLIAPSGAGKSTLIRILSGLDRDYAGTVSIRCGLRTAVFQEPGLFTHKTLRDNIRYPLRPAGRSPSGALDRRYARWLGVTGLYEAQDLYPFQVSGGMKQMTAIARAFLLRPDLVLMDEPFKSVDPGAKERIMAHIRETCPETTLVMTTHHRDEPALIRGRDIRFTGPHLSGTCPGTT